MLTQFKFNRAPEIEIILKVDLIKSDIRCNKSKESLKSELMQTETDILKVNQGERQAL